VYLRFSTLLLFAGLGSGLIARSGAAQDLNYAAAPTGGHSASQPHEGLPILAPSVQPKPGFYHTVAEFRHNEPSEPGLPEVDTRPYTGTEWAGENEIKPYHLSATGQRTLATDVWGFCDGENYYIRQGQSFYRLLWRNQGFVFFGRKGESAGLYAAHTAANALALASVLHGGSGHVSTASPEHRTLFYLDLLNGSISLDQPVLPAAPGSVLTPAHLFIYRPHNAKGPAVHIRLVEGQPAQELAPGDYLSLFPDKNQPLRLCLLADSGAETHFDITPSTAACTYLEYRPASGSSLRLVPYTEGYAALKRLAR
jgi:hypothetical protein